MGKIKDRLAWMPGKKLVMTIVLCGFVFAASITLLFTQEKQRLDETFESTIISSLNIHTHNNAAQINRAIADAEYAMQTAAAMLRLVDAAPRDFLAQRNAENPACVVEYLTAEQLEAGALSSLAQDEDGEASRLLARGETVAGDIRYDEALAGYSLSVIMPLREGEGAPGALYTRVSMDGLLREVSESAVYQDVQSCLVTGDGSIVFNTFMPGQNGNMIAGLAEFGVAPAEIERIADMIGTLEVDSVTFRSQGQAYFASADRLTHNGWALVVFVRGSEALLHLARIFQGVIRTGAVSILITAAVICGVFILLLSSRKKLEREQQLSAALTQRFQAMFDQHTALKVVLDAATGEIVDANPAILSYFGYTKAEVLGRRTQEYNLLPPEVHDERIRSELNGEALFSAAPYRLKNGEVRLMDVHASAIMGGERRLLYAILSDVTDRERYRNELLQEKELLKTTLQSIGDGVVTTDNRGVITSMNSVAEQLTGWDSDFAAGRPFTDVFILQNEDTGQTVENPVQKVLETGRVIGLANHTELKNRRGECIPIADSAAPIKAQDGKIFGVVMVFRDVGDEKAYSKQIEFLSYHDSLTGLYNRRYLEEAMLRLSISGQLPVSVIMADVNGLKITNDVFGHKAGDKLLQGVAGVLKEHCKKDDMVARWGGDEFVILMPGTDLGAAEAIISDIKNNHIVVEGGGLSLSLSLGCACRDAAEKSMRAIMQQAEEHMYHQKLLDGKSYRNAIISTLLATLYEKSNETEGHSKRLEKYCHDIGRRLQLSSKEMDELSLLALLHDIGKVSIDPNILTKPGPLTPAEWDEMKRHPEIGYRIAQVAPELAAVADLILSHHERWDGEGYPHGLKGTEIPLACRILALADAYDAMMSDRVYRNAGSGEDAICELEKNVGTQFDPDIASIFIAFLRGEEENA